MEFKVDENTFTYVDAIKESLRLLPQWILLSEARSKEVKYLIESLSTGAKCITTLHTDDVTKVPDRIENMLQSEAVSDSFKDQIYEFLDIAILVDKSIAVDDDGTEHIERFISQVAVYTHDKDKNICNLIVDDGKLVNEQIQDSVLKKFKLAGINNPFSYYKQDWGSQMEQVYAYRASLENSGVVVDE